ncbi:UNVERIFIED_CONTAM: hypothetical protein NCL1_13654 [Trichonephila clavipes]
MSALTYLDDIHSKHPTSILQTFSLQDRKSRIFLDILKKGIALNSTKLSSSEGCKIYPKEQCMMKVSKKRVLKNSLRGAHHYDDQHANV